MYNGNFQTGDFDAALARLDNTKEINERDPFVDVGDFTLMLLTLAPFNHTQHGPSCRANFEVMASSNPNVMVGSRVTKIWLLSRPSKFPSQANDADRFADFVRNLIGAQGGQQVGPQCRALIRDRVADQLGRGMLIYARGVNTSKNAAKPWVEVYWKNYPQTQDDIKSRRVQVEAKLNAQPQQQPQVAPNVQQQVQMPPGAQPGYGPTPAQQIQGAPNPMYYPGQPQQVAPSPWPGQPATPIQQPTAMPGPYPGTNAPGLTQQLPQGNNGGQGGNNNGGGLLPF